MAAAERHEFENLILMCPNHHTLIDDLESARHTTEFLTDLKYRMMTDRWRPSTSEMDRVVRLAARQLGIIEAPRESDSLPRQAGGDHRPEGRPYDWLLRQVEKELPAMAELDMAAPYHVNDELAYRALPDILKGLRIEDNPHTLLEDKLDAVLSSLMRVGAIEDAIEI
jgi:hypothetical protein